MIVFDASALLAYLNDEPGAEHIEELFSTGATIHHVNLAEVLTKHSDRGEDPSNVLKRWERTGLIGQLLSVDQGQAQDDVEVARLRPLTKAQGLSLGDRYCLALAKRLGQDAVTTDKSWANVNVGVTVQLVR